MCEEKICPQCKRDKFGSYLGHKYPWTCKSGTVGLQTLFLECDEGWNDLIDKCFEEIQDWYTANCPNGEQMPYVCQVKEKFGGLRIYLSFGSDAAWDIAEKYEKLSTKVCENCGAEGSMRHRGSWLKTLCVDCADKLGYAK